MATVSRNRYGKKGERITVLNKDGTVGAIIYVDKNGKVHCDSWINVRQTSKTKFSKAMDLGTQRKVAQRKIKFNPSRRECTILGRIENEFTSN